MFVMSLSHVFKNKEQQIGISKYRESLYPIEHSHEFYEIEFVLSGRGIHKVGSDQLETQPGDLFFTNIATPHAFCSLNSEEPLVVYNLAFHANLLDNLQITMKNGEPNATGAARFIFSKILSKPYIKLENVSEAENILEQMYREGREEKENFEGVLTGLLIELLNLMNISYKQTQAGRSSADYIKDVMSYIDNHYSEELTTEKLAGIAMMSPSHFCTVFKNKTGVTPNNYIVMKRLENAKELLENSEHTVAEVSLMIGYESESYFRKIFKAHFGSSPKSYREAKQPKER